MKLVFIYGMPATGKLTVAKELAALTDYKLFHNHLVVDLLMEVFEFGTKSFVELRERIWLDVFKSASDSGADGLVFTFAPEKTVRQEFIERTISQCKAAGDKLVFVELHCDTAEMEKRLGSDERKRHKKLTSFELMRELASAKTFDTPRVPEPDLRIDTGRHAPKESALMIARFLGAG